MARAAVKVGERAKLRLIKELRVVTVYE